MASRNGSYTTSDLSRKSGDIIAEALRDPVREFIARRRSFSEVVRHR
jgi:hypothetical protein